MQKFQDIEEAHLRQMKLLIKAYSHSIEDTHVQVGQVQLASISFETLIISFNLSFYFHSVIVLKTVCPAELPLWFTVVLDDVVLISYPRLNLVFVPPSGP